MFTELVFGQAPFVVYVTVYVPSALALTSICPVDVLRNTSPAGLDVNVPPARPVMVAEGSAPVWQYVEDEYVKAALSFGFTVIVTVIGLPVQEPAVGIIVYTAVPAAEPVVLRGCAMEVPDPAEAPVTPV